MTSPFNKIHEGVMKFIERQRWLEIRKERELDWERQIEDVNPDIDPYYNRPRQILREPFVPSLELIEWLKHCREMDDDAFCRDNGILKSW